MFSRIMSAVIYGVDCIPIHVEADVSNGLPMFSMVGYLSSRVKEAQDRVRTALKNTGFLFPAKRITVNLSPADIRKEGTGFDLPIAAALLCAFGYLEESKVQGVCMAGELSLNGEIHRIRGILPIVNTAVKQGCRLCIIPKENLKETEYIDQIPILGVSSLCDFMECAKQEAWGARRHPTKKWESEEGKDGEDFSDILGQEAAKRAAVIAAAGFHNLLLVGTKGSGKTMIARRLPSILPGLTKEESMEVSQIYSAAGLLSEERPILKRRPFRAPHHTISEKAMAGGGVFPKPGEITLAHKGILFLDELPEFSRAAIEVLRQPLESKNITISRIGSTCDFPADFLLVAAMNPCLCGYYPDRNRCSCTEVQVARYQRKISGPLLDRFDLCSEVQEVRPTSLFQRQKGSSSAQIRAEIKAAYTLQRERYQEIGILFNSQLSGDKTQEYCQMTKEAEKLLQKAYEKMNLSVRAYHKILKTARTIADLQQMEKIEEAHISEAVCYRAMDQK